jgi:hypothetical protein
MQNVVLGIMIMGGKQYSWSNLISFNFFNYVMRDKFLPYKL